MTFYSFFLLLFFTLYMEIFIVKIFSWFTKTRKPRKKKTRKIFHLTTKINHHSQQILLTWYVSQRSLAIVVSGKKVYRFSTAIASYFARDGLRVRYPQMTHRKRVIIFSVSDNRPSLLPQNVYTAFLGTLSYEYCSSPTAAW